MRILQVSTADYAGGAESVARQLMQAYRRAGHESWLAVGQKIGNDADVFVVPNESRRSRWSRGCLVVATKVKSILGATPAAQVVSRLMRLGFGQPVRAFQKWQGREDYDFPGTELLDEISPNRPDLIHGHNLHGAGLPDGGFFDLEALPRLSRRYPLVVTLHDAWMLSGHCAHSFDCDRWKTGCGACPDLTIYPAIRRDATAYNWERKRKIYAQSRIYVATPSQWLMQKVENSMLAPAIVGSKVIPNGVDLSVFHPGDKLVARKILGIPLHARVMLFAANGIRSNVWKDYATIRKAAEQTAQRMKGQEIVLIALGEEGRCERAGNLTIQFIAHERDPVKIAQYFQAADLYVHASRAETFPHSILEALACGLPVVATSVGGIPEQVDDGKTGFLVPAGDAVAMAEKTVSLFMDGGLRQRCAVEAAQSARVRFHLEHQVAAYIGWYEEILSSETAQPGNWSGAMRQCSRGPREVFA